MRPLPVRYGNGFVHMWPPQRVFTYVQMKEIGPSLSVSTVTCDLTRSIGNVLFVYGNFLKFFWTGNNCTKCIDKISKCI